MKRQILFRFAIAVTALHIAGAWAVLFAASASLSPLVGDCGLLHKRSNVVTGHIPEQAQQKQQKQDEAGRQPFTTAPSLLRWPSADPRSNSQFFIVTLHSPSQLRAVGNADDCLAFDRDIIADELILRRAAYPEKGGESGANDTGCGPVVSNNQSPIWIVGWQGAPQSRAQHILLRANQVASKGLQGNARLEGNFAGQKSNSHWRSSVDMDRDRPAGDVQITADGLNASGLDDEAHRFHVLGFVAWPALENVRGGWRDWIGRGNDYADHGDQNGPYDQQHGIELVNYGAAHEQSVSLCAAVSQV